MKKILFIIVGVLFLTAVVFLVLKIQNKNLNVPVASKPIISIQPMKIQSSAFENNQNIPAKYTCDAEGVNPPLEFLDVPKEAKSLALVVDDPDASSGTWTHWLVWNISPETNKLSENSVPDKSLQGQTSSGQNVYGGLCPPSGTHHYFFKLFALDAKLSISSFSTSADLEKAMQTHIISHAELVGLYSRGK